MKKNSFSVLQKLRYNFENTLSRGTIAIIGWLAIFSLLIVFLAALVISFVGIKPPEGEEIGFIEAAWLSLMRTFDAGNMADDAGWPFRVVTLGVTLGGIFIISTFIGTLTSGIENAIEELRKGRSRVLEENHILILGWSSKVFSIISELVIANENQKKPRIVIMADRDKVEMEDEIRSKISDTKNTKIVCRTGNPLDLSDLEIISFNEAKSIIILSPEVENGDIYVIKSTLALTNNPDRREEKFHIVAEIKDENNLEAAHLVGGDEAVFVLSSDLIARVTAQTCRQNGLSVVYTELLDFDGAEIYFKNEPSLIGKTFKDAAFAYEESAVMGLYHSNGQVSINPEHNKILIPGDQIIAISEDDDTLVLSNRKELSVSKQTIRNQSTTFQEIEKTLILGWNERGILIIQELDQYVGQGSQVLVVDENLEVGEIVEELATRMEKQTIGFKKARITERAGLDALDVISFDHIIVLCNPSIEVQEADARTLITLLHLRAIADSTEKDLSIVTEMLDTRNRALAEVARPDDFIVSDKLVSLMLSQLSENKHLKKVFDDLFRAEGSEIYLKAAANYVQLGIPVNFYTILESASQQNHLAIGYRLNSYASQPDKGYGVVVSPNKAEEVTFCDEDKIIVLAEN